MSFLKLLPAVVGAPFVIATGILLYKFKEGYSAFLELPRKCKMIREFGLWLCGIVFLIGAVFVIDGAARPALSAPHSATPSCADLGGRLAGFFDACAGEWQVLGVRGSKVTTKCCTQLELTTTVTNTSSSLSYLLPPGVAAVPSAQGSQYDDQASALRHLAVCPHLAGSIIPQGFLTMAVSSVLGTVVMLVLNGIRGSCSGKKTPLYIRVLIPGQLGYWKTLLSVFVGLVGASIAAHQGSDPWDRYEIFCSMLVNGAVLQNLVDFFVFMILSERRFQTYITEYSNALYKKRHKVAEGSNNEGDVELKGGMELNAETAYEEEFEDQKYWSLDEDTEIFRGMILMTLLAFALPLVPPLLTHWGGGFLLFLFPTIVVIAAVEAIGRLMGLAVEHAVAQCSLGWALYAKCFFLLVRINFELMILFRLPFNLALFVTGGSTYPYFDAPKDVFDGASWLEAPFYLFQMSSLNCYTLRAYTSANHFTNIIFTLL